MRRPMVGAWPLTGVRWSKMKPNGAAMAAARELRTTGLSLRKIGAALEARGMLLLRCMPNAAFVAPSVAVAPSTSGSRQAGLAIAIGVGRTRRPSPDRRRWRWAGEGQSTASERATAADRGHAT